MIVRFNNDYLERLFLGLSLKGKLKYNEQVVTKFKKTILILKNTDSINQIRLFRGLNFEALKGEYKGFYSVRVDLHYRLVIRIEISDVLTIEDLTNHYQ